MSEIITGAGVEDPTDGQLALLATGMQHYKLGLGDAIAHFETTVGSFTADIYVAQMPLTASQKSSVILRKKSSGCRKPNTVVRK